MDDEIDMDEAAQVCLLNTLQPGGSLVAAGEGKRHSTAVHPRIILSTRTGSHLTHVM